MLKITIEGLPGEGKTTLANEIQALLESINMAVTVDDVDRKLGTDYPHLHEARVEAMGGREVHIVTVNTQRQPKEWALGEGDTPTFVDEVNKKPKKGKV